MFTLTFYTMVGILFIIVIGFYLTKKDILNDEVSEKMSYILTNIILPCQVFMALQVDVSTVTTKDILLALAMDTVFFLSVIVIGFLICKILKISEEKNGVIVCTLAFGNVGFIAFPLLSNIMGSNTSFYVAIGQIPFNILFFTLGVYILANDNSKERIKFRALLSPNLIAIAIGLIFFVSNLQLHKALSVSIDLLARMCAPISLFILGHFLANMDLEEAFMDKEVYVITAIKLFLIPYIFLSLFQGINHNKMLLASSLTLYALPTVTLVPIYAKEYNADYNLASKVVFLTTAISLVSTPMFVYLMQKVISF